MLLIIHNLPPDTRYSDIKSLLQTKCGLTELILDNLLPEGNGKKVTVGLAEEEDAAILVRKINGLYLNGKQLYVEDVRKNKASEQPYRSTTKLMEESQLKGFEEPNKRAMSHGAMIPMMVPAPISNYNMPVSGAYYMQSGQGSSFMGYNDQPQVAPQPVLQPQYSQYPVQQEPDRNQANVGTNWSFDWGHNNASTTPANVQNHQQRDSSIFPLGNIQTRKSPNRGHNFNENQPVRDSKRVSRWDNSNMVSDRDRRRETSPLGWSSRDRYQATSGTSHHTNFLQPETSNPNSYSQIKPKKPFSISTSHRHAYNQSPSNSSASQRSNFLRMSYNKSRDAHPSGNSSTSFVKRSEVPSGRIDRAQNLSNKRKSSWDKSSREPELDDPAFARNYRPRKRYSPPPKRFRNTDSNNRESGTGKSFGKPKYLVRHRFDTRKGSPPKTLTNTFEGNTPIEVQNKGTTYRGQATSYIANNILQNLKLTGVSKNNRLMKKLKGSVRERVNRLLGDKLLVPPEIIFKMYRKRFSIKDDETLYSVVVKQVEELNINNSDTKEPGNSEEIAKSKLDMSAEVTAPVTLMETLSSAIMTPLVPNTDPSSPNSIPVPAPERTPKYPKGDKKIYTHDKQQVKKEFSGEITYELHDKELKKMFEVETEIICNKFMETFVDPQNEIDEHICKQVANKPEILNDFRNVLRLLLSKRMLNIGPILLRIYCDKRPNRASIDEFLRPYGVVSLKKSQRKPMYTASFKTYDAIDRLCTMESATIGDMTISFKPMYVTGPTRKVIQKKFAQKRKNCNEIDYSDDVNLLENPAGSVDFTDDLELSGETSENPDNRTETEDLTEDSIKDFDEDILALEKELTKDFNDEKIDVIVVKSEKSENEHEVTVNSATDGLFFYEDCHGDYPSDDKSENIQLINEVSGNHLTSEDVNEKKAVNDNPASKINSDESDNKDSCKITVDLAENGNDVSNCNIVITKVETEENTDDTKDEDAGFDNAGDNEYPDVDIDDVNDDDLEDY